VTELAARGLIDLYYRYFPDGTPVDAAIDIAIREELPADAVQSAPRRISDESGTCIRYVVTSQQLAARGLVRVIVRNTTGLSGEQTSTVDLYGEYADRQYNEDCS